MTNKSSVIGTWAYLAPERITTAESDARADIYALACVLYECLTGSQPFPGDSLEQQIGGHIAMPPPRASDRHADVPSGLDAVIAKGMAKNPDERYATTRELAYAAKSAVTAPMPRPKTVTPSTPTAFANSYVKPPVPPPPAAPTQYRIADAPTERHSGRPGPPPYRPLVPPGPPGPAQNWPPPPGPNPASSKPSRKGLLIALSSVAVVAIAAIVAAIVLSKPEPGADGAGEPPCPNGADNAPVCTLPGPFTGSYAVAFGPQFKSTGEAAPDAPPPFTETWRLRSECGPDDECVATAKSGGKFASDDLVFDQVGESWIAVSTSSTTSQGHRRRGMECDLVATPGG